MLITNYDTSIIFLRDNKYEGAQYTAVGGDKVLLAGMVMGRVTATGQLLQCKSAASDGSVVPVGILTKDITVLDTIVADVNICTGGEVAEEKVVMDGSDTLDTIYSARRLRDRIAGDTVGIVLVPGIENTINDNQ